MQSEGLIEGALLNYYRNNYRLTGCTLNSPLELFLSLFCYHIHINNIRALCLSIMTGGDLKESACHRQVEIREPSSAPCIPLSRHFQFHWGFYFVRSPVAYLGLVLFVCLCLCLFSQCWATIRRNYTAPGSVSWHILIARRRQGQRHRLRHQQRQRRHRQRRQGVARPFEGHLGA